jgi:hypothetical protein
MVDGGVFVCSVSTFPDNDYHVTMEHKPWWDALFKEHGFEVDAPMKNWGRQCDQPWNIASDFEGAYKKLP